MRDSRGFKLVFWGSLLVSLWAGPARAQLLIAEPADTGAGVEYAELAYAVGETDPVSWLSLRASHGPLALVAAVGADAAVEAGLDAWFEALEATASPFVSAPAGSGSRCAPLVAQRVTWPRSAGAAAEELSLQDADDVRALLDERGLALTQPLPNAPRYAVWAWPRSQQPFTTRTLRVAGPGEPLALLPSAPFPVLVSALTRGAMAYVNERPKSELSVTFRPGEPPENDYRERLLEWLAARPEPVLEQRARGPIFDWAVYESVSLAPLVSSYASAAAAERPELDAAACAEQLRALRDPSAPAAVACGAASDASLGLAAVRSDLATLARLVVSGASGVSWQAFEAGGQPSSPVLRASLLETTSCGDSSPAMVPVVDRPAPGAGSLPPPARRDDEEEASLERQPIEVSCISTTQPDPYYDDPSSDGCSSDSSSSSNDDVDCSSDSSGSSQPTSDADCSSDSSETSDSGDCSGSSESSGGYDGDTCVGDSAARSEQASRPQRLRLSLWSLACAAMILPIRRRKRGLRAGG